MGDERAVYRAEMIRGRAEAAAGFDKAMVSLPAGALALSLGLIRAAHGPLPYVWVLLTAWACFTASLLSAVFSHRTAHEAYSRQLKALEGVDDDAIYQGEPGGRFHTWTVALNNLSVSFLILGIVALSTFVGVNLEGLR